METFSALLAIRAGNSLVTGEFPAQRPVTQSYDVFFDLRLNKRLSKQSWGWWFETPSRPLWRHINVKHITMRHVAAIVGAIIQVRCLVVESLKIGHALMKSVLPDIQISCSDLAQR